MATGRSNNSHQPASAASRSLPPSDSVQRQRNSPSLGAEGGMDVSTDVWYDDDDDAVAASKEAASVLPAAAGDCSPRPNCRCPTTFVPDSELYAADDYQRHNVGRRAYSEQLDRKLFRRQPDTSQSDKTVGHVTHEDKRLGRWSRPADTDVDDVDKWTSHDLRQRRALPDVHHPAAGAGDNDPAQSTLTQQQTDYVDQYVTHVDHRRGGPASVRRRRSTDSYQRQQSTRDTVDDDRDTASEPAGVVEFARYDIIDEDFRSAKSAVIDPRHTRRPTTSTKTDQRADSATLSLQQRSSKASRSTEQRDADVSSQLYESQDSWSRQHEHDVARRCKTATTADLASLERSTDDDSRPRRRSHDQRRHDQRHQPVISEPDSVPRRLVFRRSRRGYKKSDVDFVVDDDDVSGQDVGVEDERRTKSTSLVERVEKLRSVRSLVRAVNQAAMRVNPGDPDAFLSLLSTRAGQAEQLDDPADVYDQAVQTDVQPLLLHVDADSSARLKQLQREMVDLQRQQQITEVVTYVMAPIAVILMLLFADKLWAAAHTGVHIAE